MSDWTSLGTEVPVPIYVADEVVEAEDGTIGPLIVTFRDPDGALHVGVAIERVDDETVRWIEAPVEAAGWDLARRGVIPLRALFLKAEHPTIVDRKGDLTPCRAWRMPIDLMRPEHLPEEGATLEAEDEPEEDAS